MTQEYRSNARFATANEKFEFDLWSLPNKKAHLNQNAIQVGLKFLGRINQCYFLGASAFLPSKMSDTAHIIRGEIIGFRFKNALALSTVLIAFSE